MTTPGLQDAITRWQEFCNGLSASGREILESAEHADGVSQAEGLRYLTRLLRSGIEKFIDFVSTFYASFGPATSYIPVSHERTD